MKYNTDNLRIKEIRELSTPAEVHAEYPISERATETVHAAREAVHRILHRRDDRLLVVVGPCSVHDPAAALEYGRRLLAVRERLAGELEIVMRVYFEKPRTTVGWKGLINDPDIDNSFHINKGLRLARKLLLDLAEMGLPAGTEFLDLITPQYFSDLISWGAIGARTTESQGHRELASGLSCPIGFKNGTDGTVQIAVDAIRAAARPHAFLGVTAEGRSAIVLTTGNEDCHIILRGGRQPNYDAASVDDAAALLEKAGLDPRIMIDASHANSRKIHERQIDVTHDIAAQVAGGDERIFGVMIESHLVAGRQDVVPGKPLTFGQSITDACLGWDDTEPLLEHLAGAVRARRRAVGGRAAEGA
ncbi:MAG: phospho-2-dehydro-3-deoxyheptonate aldolase [Gammaproteobacteria bacterium]|nr:MAG: phospho-2-dehydro-3-deoxyheptonate aldolase [Gammaproteobacteria bacterium]